MSRQLIVESQPQAARLREKCGQQRTIWAKGKHLLLGGNDETQAADASGKLQELLQLICYVVASPVNLDTLLPIIGLPLLGIAAMLELQIEMTNLSF